jgi:transcriptional regulator with XRE-family HTH domain
MLVANPMAQRRHKPSGNTNTVTRDIANEYRRIMGDYLKTLRQSKGITQKELGKLIGVSETSVSGTEGGRTVLNSDRYEDVARVLEVDRTEFGKFMLRYTNPWLYSMIFPANRDRQLKEDLATILSRLKKHRQ